MIVDVPGISTLTFTSTDAAGNVGTSTVVVRIDPVPPTVTITSPASGATYTTGQAVNAAYACADPAPASGIPAGGCVGTVANGARRSTRQPSGPTRSR